MLTLTSIEQIKQDVSAYIGADAAGEADISASRILRQYKSPFPSEIVSVDQLWTDDPVTVSLDFVDGQDYIIFSTTQ